MIWNIFFKTQRRVIVVLLLHLVIAFNTRVHGAQVFISFDVCYTGHHDVLIVDVTFKRCVLECQMRHSCVSINYLERMHLCRLNTVTSMIHECESPGFVFSNKSHWENTTVPTECELCGHYQTCVLGKGINTSAVCMFTECQPIEQPTDGRLLGNLVNVGAKVLPECNAGYNAYPPGVRICQDSGQWNLPAPLCLTDIPDIPNKDSCYSGWISYGSSCYLATRMQKTYNDSVEFCASQDSRAHVVTLESEPEKAFVQHQIDTTLGSSKKKNDACWLGITERLETGVWRYTHNGQLVTWLKFARGEPNDNRGIIEECAALYVGTTWKWIDTDCNKPGYLMCELQR